MLPALQHRYSLDLEEFEYFRTWAKQLAGISLSDSKRELVQSRLRSRLQELGLSSFQDYRELLQNLPSSHTEWQEFVNLLTTNKTDWFREPAHFRHLEEVFLPRWRALGRRKLSVWSAACSTGEEPYSIALTLNAHIGAGLSYEILATDIDTEVLKYAENGVYQKSRLEQVPAAYRSGFSFGTGELSHWMKVKKNLKERVRFGRCNLTSDRPPSKGQFDLIFCRNVLIYFQRETIEKVIENLYQAAAPGATLFIGHSESLNNLKVSWKYVSPSIFVKKGPS